MPQQYPSLDAIFKEFADKFTPGEGKESVREYLLERGGVPPNEVGRMLASMAAARNEAKARVPMSQWQTPLDAMKEQFFRAWLQQGHINFDPDNPNPDYDMRGWWQAMMQGAPNATYNLSEQLTPLFPPSFTTPWSLDFGPESKFWKRK